MTKMFDQMQEYGRQIRYGWVQFGDTRDIGYSSTVDEDEVKECLKRDAIETLPPNTRFEIRKMIAMNYGRSKGMAWYYGPQLRADNTPEPWGFEGNRVPPEGGYILLGQYVTP